MSTAQHYSLVSRWCIGLVILLAGWAGAGAVWAANLAANPGFEDWANGRPARWLSEGSATLGPASATHQGSKAVRVDARATYSGVKQANISSAGAAGRRIRLSCWLRDADSTSKPACGTKLLRLMLIQWTPQGPVFNTIDSSIIGNELPDEWRQLTLNVGLSEPVINTLEIQIGLFQTDGFSFLVDEVQLEISGPPVTNDDQPTTNAIIYYSTLYTNQPCLRQASFGNAGSLHFCRDVTGDGLDDAVACDPAAGLWQVARSNGQIFGMDEVWRNDFASTSGQALLGDVNGDGKTDAALLDQDGARWRVACSTGSAFAGESVWSATGIKGSTAAFLADVNGDGRADAVQYQGSAGSWLVGLSTGTGFQPFTQWTSGHGVGSTSQLMGDVDGDGRADSVAFFGSGPLAGNWYVARSTGSGFGAYSQWATQSGSGSSRQFLYDMNRDGRADAVWVQTGAWRVAPSTGAAFGSSWPWIDGFMNHAAFKMPVDQLLGCLDGRQAHALCIWKAIWYALANERYGTVKSAYMDNDWAAWGAVHFPSDRGAPARYDCLDSDVLRDHVREIHDAGYNVIMVDHTNSVFVGWITARINQLVQVIDEWNQALPPGGHKMYYCVSVGGWRATDPHDPDIFEKEAAFVYDNYAAWSENYYYLNGKPLLVNFAWTADRARQWEAAQIAKPYTSRFTVRWMLNRIVDSPDCVNAYGWPVYGESGNPAGDEVMDVSPGFNNQVGAPAQDRQTGQVFRGQWCRVLQFRPRSVWVNSFNEFIERTAIQPAWSPAEQWTDYYGERCDDFYWQMARQYTKLFMEHTLYVGSYIQENGQAAVYRVTSSGFDYQGTMPHHAPVLLVPAGFRAGFQGRRITEPVRTAASNWLPY